MNHEIHEKHERFGTPFLDSHISPLQGGIEGGMGGVVGGWGFNPNSEVGRAKNGQARLSSRAAVSGEAIQISGLLRGVYPERSRRTRNDEPQLFPIFNK